MDDDIDQDLIMEELQKLDQLKQMNAMLEKQLMSQIGLEKSQLQSLVKDISTSSIRSKVVESIPVSMRK